MVKIPSCIYVPSREIGLHMGDLSTHKSCLCNHVGMQKWQVNYWETYSPVVNYMSLRDMLIINILRDLHTKSVDFFWPEIFMELLIGH